MSVRPILTVRASLLADALTGCKTHNLTNVESIPDIELYEMTSGLIGAELKVNNIEYRVISNDTTNGTIDLVSTNALGNVTLGYNDPIAIANATDINNDGQVTFDEKALYSYNNAVETLVMACVEESGIETVDGTNVISIRCIGNENVKYTSQGLTGTDSEYYTSIEGKSFANGYNIKSQGQLYEADTELLTAYVNKEYWITSRYIGEGGDNIAATVNFIQNGSIENWDCILHLARVSNVQYETYGEYVTYDNYWIYNSPSKGIRPIITLSASVIGNAFLNSEIEY